MTLTIHDCQQRTDEWFAARRGIVTASLVGKLITTGSPDASTVDCQTCRSVAGNPCYSLAQTKGAPKPIKTIHDARAAAAADLPPVYVPADNDTSRGVAATLIAERITGWNDDPAYVSDDMMRGILHEPVARDRYAEHNKVTVTEVGFLTRDDWGFTIGASPDGLVGDDGGLEVKCPRPKGHIATILSDEVPAPYMPQIQASLLVSGCDWWDYVSFCAGLPLFTKRVYPDPAWQDAIVAAVESFERVAEERISDYFTKSAGLPATERIYDDLRVA